MKFQFKSAPTGSPEMDRVFAQLDEIYNGCSDNLGDYQLAAGLARRFDISLKQALPYVYAWRKQS